VKTLNQASDNAECRWARARFRWTLLHTVRLGLWLTGEQVEQMQHGDKETSYNKVLRGKAQALLEGDQDLKVKVDELLQERCLKRENLRCYELRDESDCDMG